MILDKFFAFCSSKAVGRLVSTTAVQNLNPRNPNAPVLASRVQGVVKWFDAIKGFGFITRNDNKQDVFVHLTSIKGKNPSHQTRTVADGEPVEFDVVQGNAGFEAVGVTGPGGAPVQGNPLAIQTRRQMQNAAGSFGVPIPSQNYAPGQNYYGGTAVPSLGTGGGFGAPPAPGAFGVPPAPGAFGVPPAPGAFWGPVPGAAGFGTPGGFQGGFQSGGFAPQ